MKRAACVCAYVHGHIVCGRVWTCVDKCLDLNSQNIIVKNAFAECLWSVFPIKTKYEKGYGSSEI